MEIVISIAAKIAEYTVEPVGQCLGYLFYYSSNIQNMKKQVDKLQGARDRVQHSIDAAIRDAEEIEADVKMWLENVDVIMGKVKEVLEGEENAKMRSFNGACLNLKLRHQQSKKAKKMVQDIDEVVKNGGFEKVSFRPPSQATMTTTYKDYMTFESRMSIVEQLMDALGDANINVIGVWGMPGVGKTTLVRKVAKQVKEEKLFDEVVIATVTQSPDLIRIQGEIADKLDLKFEKETVQGRAIRLEERLSKHNKILVILDDIWEKLDFEKVGIPSKGCKVVVTSRNRDILSCEMGTEKDFELKVLPEEEAWSLFEMMAGKSVKDPNLRSTATEVAKECAGLPIALVTVSKALKNKSLYEWKDALQLLRRPAPGNLSKMLSTIYSSIELSYSHLESLEAQMIFLHCSQIGYSIAYLDLLKYSYGLCLFHGINTLEEARNRLYSLVRNLRDSCLLLDCPHSCDHLHMHDLVRDVAILIASKHHNMFMVGDGGKVKEWPDVEALKRCTTFSISDKDELPDEMECPELRLFHVIGGNHSLQIADTFFKGMGKLKVLDLTKMKLSSLPTSLHLLRNLQTLCLDYCQLGDIAVIGELKNLEILSLLGSELSHLPGEIGLLTSIRLLDLSHCSKLEVIPPNVLSRLVQLEALYMGDSFVQWGNGGLNIDRTNASLTELKHLSHLITLEIHIRDASILPKDLFFEKLERYRIFVGDVWDWSDKYETSRELRLKLNTTLQFESGIKMLLNGIEHLCLDELEGVKSILYELDREGFQQLRHLHVQNNAKIKHIINSRVLAATEIVFPVLEKFSVKNMINLEEICHGKLPPTTFCNLRIVKVEHCDQLKFVFTSSIAKGLSQLQELEIRECGIMGAVVIKEEGDIEDGDIILFPQLRRLALQRLPKLMSFLNTQSSFVTDAGEIIHEGRLDFHMPVLHEQVVFPNLDSLELSLPDMEEIQRNHHWARSSSKSTNIQVAKRFQNLSILEVQGSGSLKYLLSYSTARFMMNVKHLHIIECKVMEEVLHIDEEETLADALFPRLECLFLQDLPILKRFCTDSNVEFPLLKNFIINNCPKLKTFAFRHASSNMEVRKGLVEINSEDNRHATSQLHINESIVLASLESLEQSLIDLEEKQQSQHWARSFCKITNMQTSIRFQNLLYLGVWGSDSFKYLLSSSIARSMVQVKDLHIVNCNAMEEILFIEDLGDKEEEEEEDEEIIPKMLFPRLEVLILRDLPILKRFCVGGNIEFKSMRSLFIEHCPKLKTFVSKTPNSDTVMTVCKEIKEMNTEEIPRSVAIQPLFSEEVAFPNLESLIISHLPNLKIIWHDKFAPGSFMKLQTMKVELCENLMEIFQVNMLSRFHSLDYLIVDGCGSLQEIFEPQGQEVMETHAVTVTQLTKLVICRLPKLKRVWNKDPQRTFSFPNLQEIVVGECESLKSLFPTSVARCLQHLNGLRIFECGIEEIIEQEEGAKEDVRFVFPKLTLLILRKLSKLKWFYRGVHTSEWPLLEYLEVSGSNEIQIFASKNYRIQEQDDQSQLETSIQQPLFLVEEVAFPSLEKLYLDQCVLEDIAMIGELRNLEILRLRGSNVEQLPTETGLLTRLRILNLSNCTKLKVIPPNVLSCLIQLEELYFGNSFSQWEVEGLNNERASLAELKHLSRLTTLEVHIPDANMLPKDLLFEKLQRYKIFVGDVWDWSDEHENSRALKLKLNTSFHLERGIKMLLNGIENLCLDELKGVKSVIYELDMTGFQQLKHLHVQNNVEIKYIINSRGMVISDGVFPVLEMLSLKNMINLEEICHGQIPSASFRNLSIIKVLICDKLKNLVPSWVSFQNLTNLEICKCNGLINLVTSSTAKSLVQLKKMSVSECERITEVVTGEGGEASEVITFTQLTYLQLDCLPNLSSFCSISYSFEFPSLEEVIVRHCPEMKTFSHGALGTPKLERVQATQEDEWHWKANLNTTIHWLWKSKYNTTTQ